MKIMILGGTIFLGRHIVEYALKKGHDVTLFNRGVSNPDLFPEADKLKGDRKTGDYSALEGTSWDAVIDPSGYYPRAISQLALAVKNVGHYSFVSSISVYEDFTTPGTDEDSPVIKLEDETTEKIDGLSYGGLKALCEQKAEELFPGKVHNIRPGLIVGPHDPSNRFTYWPTRIAKGGQVLLPGSPKRKIQYIDARDLAQWIVASAEEGVTGTHNATGPEEPITMKDFLKRATKALNATFRGVWVPDKFLLDEEVDPYVEMPLWIPGAHEEVSISLALENGLKFRSLEDTVKDTYKWASKLPSDLKFPAGLDPEKERDLIKRFKNKKEK